MKIYGFCKNATRKNNLETILPQKNCPLMYLNNLTKAKNQFKNLKSLSRVKLVDFENSKTTRFLSDSLTA